MSVHSQITNARQPATASSSKFRASLAWLPAIFAAQNSVLVAGSLNLGQSCPCQKQPLTKITARNMGKTRSGHPGSSLRWRRNLSPHLCSPRLNSISGAVSLFRIRLMLSLRWSAVRTSTIRFSSGISSVLYKVFFLDVDVYLLSFEWENSWIDRHRTAHDRCTLHRSLNVAS